MIFSLLSTIGAGLITAVTASVWAELVAGGMDQVPEIERADRSSDIRTW